PTCASFTMEPHPLAPLRLTAVGTATTGISNCRLPADLIVADHVALNPQLGGDGEKCSRKAI
ncbi:MAG: hypothetical protein ACLQBA_10075, partial [Candidatus Binataceae bacterium]